MDKLQEIINKSIQQSETGITYKLKKEHYYRQAELLIANYENLAQQEDVILDLDPDYKVHGFFDYRQKLALMIDELARFINKFSDGDPEQFVVGQKTKNDFLRLSMAGYFIRESPMPDWESPNIYDLIGTYLGIPVILKRDIPEDNVGYLIMKDGTIQRYRVNYLQNP